MGSLEILSLTTSKELMQLQYNSSRILYIYFVSTMTIFCNMNHYMDTNPIVESLHYKIVFDIQLHKILWRKKSHQLYLEWVLWAWMDPLNKISLKIEIIICIQCITGIYRKKWFYAYEVKVVICSGVDWVDMFTQKSYQILKAWNKNILIFLILSII